MQSKYAKVSRVKVFITGATGFVGHELVSSLLAKDYSVSSLVRQKSDILTIEVEQVVGDLLHLIEAKGSGVLSLLTKLNAALCGVDVVVHCAARVHVMNDHVVDPLSEFRKMNTLATLNLAKQAAEAGVRRFIFLSSIKVNGEMTMKDEPFQSDDRFVPDDPYGLSKYEAEQGLLALSKETGMEVVIIRPPLVYGPGVQANFASMMKWLYKGVPLPFGSIHNKRSLVSLDNLIDFIALCVDRKKSPKAANQIFLISDGEDISTTNLLKKTATALGKKARLIPVPIFLMKVGAKLLSKGDVANRLFGSLQVDSSKAHDLLGWSPVITMDEQLQITADAFYESENARNEKAR